MKYDVQLLRVSDTLKILFSFQDVEKFISMRKKRGIRVERLCLENSPHVQHLITVRELYITTVLNFIKECLNTSK